MENQHVAFQGEKGSYTHLALEKAVPGAIPEPCSSFEDVFLALERGELEYAFIPVENSVAGRVADIHYLLPKAEIHILSEHFEPIEHMLLAPKGATVDGLKEIHSHVHALGQCRGFISGTHAHAIVHLDTAGAARDIAEWNDPTKAAIASSLAAKMYDLDILAENIEDAEHNTTRFLLITSKKPEGIPSLDTPVITSMFFAHRSVPAALYKALGGFATNGINLTRLESYIMGEQFSRAEFFVDVEGHPESESFKHAMDELKFFSEEIRILGTYPAHEYREKSND